jgi:hypothetical protein
MEIQIFFKVNSCSNLKSKILIVETRGGHWANPLSKYQGLKYKTNTIPILVLQFIYFHLSIFLFIYWMCLCEYEITKVYVFINRIFIYKMYIVMD